MSVHSKNFDRDKALEAILLIAESLHAATLHSISKILYLADKKHLQDFGRLICGDRYVAMEYGPVPSAIYTMMKVAAKRETIDVDWDGIIKDAFKVRSGRYIAPKRRANTDLLAQSEMLCICETIDAYGDKSFGELTDITHDTAWEQTDENESISLEKIANTLPNGSEIISYLRSH